MTVDQSGSRAVLFGVHAYDHLPPLDGVRHNVPALRDLLTAAEVGGFAGEHCVAVPANSTPAALLDAVQDAADHARDLLLVYYAGHGHFGRDGRSLLLGTQASRPDRPHHSVAYDEIRAIMAGSTAQHAVVIVDCCFSGGALHMSASRERRTPDFDIEGACVLTSSAETEPSLCLPDGSVFTRELILLLRDGLSGNLPDGRRGEHLAALTMADIYETLCERLKGRTVEGHRIPAPRMSTRDSGHRIPLATNRARRTEPHPTPLSPSVAPATAYAATRYFTGREDELTALAGAVAQPGAVCVVHGRGGQGKTELLRAAAARVTSLFPGGCLEIDLRGWTPDSEPRDPHMVIAEQLHHAGHGPEQIPTDLTARAEAWRLYLNSHPVLLLLDNARDAAQLAPLLPSAGAPSAAMVSSRSELPDVDADFRHALRPLPPAHCVTVWLKMGVPPETDDLHRIADRINGSALALGPIGTRLLRGASPTAILAALSGSTPYAAFPTLDAAERAVFQSAYNALDPDLRTLIHQCAWHPGPDFGPDSLAAMAGRPEHEVAIRLTEIEQLLVRKADRYSLHDSSLAHARQTATAHSTPDEETASRARLYDHLGTGLLRAREALDFGTPDDESRTPAARRWLDEHFQELQTAARTAGTDEWPAHEDFLLEVSHSLLMDGRCIEPQELVRIVLDTTAPESMAHAVASERLGDIRRLQRTYDEAITAYQDALTLYQALGDRLGQANATGALGEIHRLQGRNHEAITAHQDSMSHYRALGNRLGQAQTTQGLGEIYQGQGRYDEATAAYLEALALYRTLGNRLGQANATRSLGDTHQAQGRDDEATAAYQEALALYRALGNRHGQANATKSLGDIHRLQGRYARAISTYQEAMALYQAVGDRHGQADITEGLGHVHKDQGRYDAATTAYRDALALRHALGNRHGQANATVSIADVHLLQGEYARATSTYENALSLYLAIGNRHGQANATMGLGDIHRLQGRYAQAKSAFRAARDLYTEMGIHDWATRCQTALADCDRAAAR
ncbi:tetratricopeptide repeat protein [Streptomyces sp. NPDC000983]|uniref:caspase, EACC1-associated type n=1 Tax=Streptomyces sp. NPDC000983 TaxID=3154373 RepID=UPI0033313B40